MHARQPLLGWCSRVFAGGFALFWQQWLPGNDVGDERTQAGVHVVFSWFTWFDRGLCTLRNCNHATNGFLVMFTWFDRVFWSVHVVFTW